VIRGIALQVRLKSRAIRGIRERAVARSGLFAGRLSERTEIIARCWPIAKQFLQNRVEDGIFGHEQGLDSGCMMLGLYLVLLGFHPPLTDARENLFVPHTI
jgi:hypothetical protein